MSLAETRFNIRRFLRRPKYRYMAVNRLVPHLPWFILIGLSVLLYKERIFADSGFYISQVINNKFFWIECQRIVLGISQLLPLSAIWLGLDLRYVLILYSVSHVLFFYALFLFVYYGLRDRRSGLLIILSQTVGIMYSFFTPMFELYYGVPLLITFYAIWKLNIRASLIVLILVILEILILLSHPLTFMLFPFLLVLDYSRKKAKPVSYYFILGMVMIGVVCLKAYMMCPYEVGKLSWQFAYDSNKKYMQLLDPAFYMEFGKYYLRYYWEELLALLLATWMFLRRKEWFKLVWVIVTFLAYLFLVGSVYTVDHSRYMEQVMFPFFVITFFPLILKFPKEPRPGLQNISVLFVSGLIAYRLFVIYSGSDLFVARVRQMENLIQSARQMGGSKFIVSSANVDKGYTQLNWSYPLESILLSAIDGDDLTVTLVPDLDYYYENNNSKAGPEQFIFRKWELKDHAWLNRQYFHLDPGAYHPLCDSNTFQDLDEISRNLRIDVHARRYYQALDTVWVQVKIVNHGTDPLRAGKGDKLFLSYFWMKGTEYLDWNGILTPLETDVIKSLSQDVRIAVPKTKGRLTLKVDFVTSGRMWFGLNSTDQVLVY
ncbi:MAG: hypothetical protein HXX13_14345 [Bacteroidetes bacterium]|nr:hypothetical protein [Bacteroidota bacterium]